MFIVSDPSTFLRQNELGMGFQFARIESRAKNKIYGLSDDVLLEYGIVFNGIIAFSALDIFSGRQNETFTEVVALLDQAIGRVREQDSGEDLKASSFVEDLAENYRLRQLEIHIGDAEISEDSEIYQRLFSASNNKTGESGGKLHNSPPVKRFSRLGDQFVRYSDFRNDLRILPDGSVSAGTYATTLADSLFAPSGFGATARYALPTPNPRCYTFSISPPDGVPIYVGACSPNYGQAGGGFEVEFKQPLPAGSGTFQRLIPEF